MFEHGYDSGGNVTDFNRPQLVVKYIKFNGTFIPKGVIYHSVLLYVSRY